MQSLLIVEDEKMIRQGIKAMVQRSGVPVDLILECANGEEALNLLATRHVDVMFTDIRMQKMDGIELVRRVGELEDKPLIVAISGYDDFTYAVEMLRNGVREYILKPVEREKIAEVLRKLDAELERKHTEHSKELEIGIRQMRELVENKDLSEAERELIISRYESLFIDSEYRICIFRFDPESDYRETYMLEDTSDGALILIKNNRVGAFLKNEMEDKCAGVSGIHKGLSELSAACREASAMRKLSFIREKNCIFGEDEPEQVNENLRERALELCTEGERTKRVQVLGTDKTDEVLQRWKVFFTALEKEMMDLSAFSKEMEESITAITEVYREHITEEDRETAEKCRVLHDFENLREYQTFFTDWILDLNKRLGDRPDDINIRQKIAQAQQYINTQYQTDLNMAVVSNYVSMNYSLFSYSFKQYTGKNFVNYLKEIRIEKAKKLLATTDLKIVEISQMVGYENEKNFMKIFKSLCGVTPGEYRKNMSA